MARLGYRARLLLILALFAAIPAVVVSAGWVLAFYRVVPMVSGRANWDRVAATGATAIDAAREAPLTPEQHAALDAHQSELSEAVSFSRQMAFLSPRIVGVLAGGIVVGLILLAWPTTRVAGHLSRQLSRPVDELVGWTQRIARGEPLPASAETRGAPEFDVLRSGMREMATQLEAGRARALEAERLSAFRESARQFAHELKNPLTPIRFAVARLQRDASPDVADAVAVLVTESARLEAMARSFAQFGRIPSGPAADIDVEELVAYTARASVPETISLVVTAAGAPTIRGHHDSLARALSNLLLNAVEACGADGAAGARITVAAESSELRGAPAVRITVTDTGPGIAADKLATIWQPYITHKPGGTGLGLAIARQAIEAHGGEVFARSGNGETSVGFVIPVNAGVPTITGEWKAADYGS